MRTSTFVSDAAYLNLLSHWWVEETSNDTNYAPLAWYQRNGRDKNVSLYAAQSSLYDTFLTLGGDVVVVVSLGGLDAYPQHRCGNQNIHTVRNHQRKDANGNPQGAELVLSMFHLLLLW